MSDMPKCPLCGLGTGYSTQLFNGRWVACECTPGDLRDEIERQRAENDRLLKVIHNLEKTCSDVYEFSHAKSDLIERQAAVIEAARPYMCAGDDCTCDLCIALRALDGGGDE